MNSNSDKTQKKQKQYYTVQQITEIYRALNHDLLIALDIINRILIEERIDFVSQQELQGLNIIYKKLNLSKEETKNNTENIHSLIYETTLRETIEKASIVFFSNESIDWSSYGDIVRRIIIKNISSNPGCLPFFETVLNSCLDIDEEFSMYNIEVNTIDMIDFEFDFTCSSFNADKIKGLSDKRLYFVNEIGKKELYFLEIAEPPSYLEIKNSFIEKCKKAIEIIDAQIREQKNTYELTPPAISKNEEVNITNQKEYSLKTIDQGLDTKSFTTSRQVLALYYLLDAVDHRGMALIDRTAKARFIQFLTGKNFDNIYKSLSNPLKGLESKKNNAAKKDAEFILQHFQLLGLTSIVDQIKRDTESID